MDDLLPSTTAPSTTTASPLHTLPTSAEEAKTEHHPFNFPFWGYIIIAAGVVLIVVLIFVAAKRQSNKKNKQKKINEYRTKEDKRFAAVAAELGEMYTATDHVKIERESRYYKKKGAPKQIKRTG